MNVVLSPIPCRIAIIGGGFSGAVVALNLLRAKHLAAVITLFEPREILGAGLAYSAPDPTHRVNVPASRLLVLADEPNAFHEWLEVSGALQADAEAELPDGRRYPRRAVFGRYVDERLRQEIGTPGAADFSHVQQAVTSVTQDGTGYVVEAADGGVYAADIVVLAVSHPAPAILPVLRPLAAAERFIANPWGEDIRRKIGADDRVLIIGTALSTADAVATLDAIGHQGNIVAISRRGLVSRQRRLHQNEPCGDFSSRPSRTALKLLQKTRRAIREATASFSCWEAVIESVRAQGSVIWGALPLHERARFLRHLRPFWDVHRYQLAPQLGDIMTQQTKAGRLTIQAARITEVQQQDGRFHVTLNHKNTARHEIFDAIINCTGPDHAHVIENTPVLTSLAKAGLIHADPHRLGIDTDLDARALNNAGAPVRNLFVAGPLARASFGELMGLPQVTSHAALVAERVGALVVSQ